ncbi:MAG: hypothetical protein ACFCVF_11700 [Kineosporiaceae bacterium]
MIAALGVAVVATRPRAAARRVAWAAAALATGVQVRVVLVTPCWREAVAHPGVDVLDLRTGDDAGTVVTAAAAAGRYVVVADPGLLWDAGDRPPAWAAGPGGWTVADLPLRCVPAVRLAATMVAEGVVGELCQVRVRGPIGVGVVDLVHVVAGERVHPPPNSTEPGVRTVDHPGSVEFGGRCARVSGVRGGRRLEGLLAGGAAVTVEEPAAGDRAGLRLEVAGDAGRLVVDLRRPLAVRLTSGIVSGVVPAAGPGHARSRRPGSHLAVDALEAIVLGRDGVGTYDDAVVAARVLRDGLEAGGEVPQRERLVDDPVPAELAGA